MDEENKPVIYVTKYKGLQLVHTPMGLKDAVGNKIPSVRCMFTATNFGYAYTTKDPGMQKWLAEHDYAIRGLIWKYDPEIAETAAKVEKVMVTLGGVTTASGKGNEAPAAAAEAAPKKAYRVEIKTPQFDEKPAPKTDKVVIPDLEGVFAGAEVGGKPGLGLESLGVEEKK